MIYYMYIISIYIYILYMYIYIYIGPGKPAVDSPPVTDWPLAIPTAASVYDESKGALVPLMFQPAHPPKFSNLARGSSTHHGN